MKAFCSGSTVIFLIKRIICFLLLLASPLSVSFYFNKSISTKMFPAILPLPIPGTKGRFPGDAALLCAWSRWDAPNCIWTVTGPTSSSAAPQRPAHTSLSEGNSSALVSLQAAANPPQFSPPQCAHKGSRAQPLSSPCYWETCSYSNSEEVDYISCCTALC